MVFIAAVSGEVRSSSDRKFLRNKKKGHPFLEPQNEKKNI
jgi:hypothetical protein